MEMFVAAAFLALFNERLIEYLARPLKKRRPEMDFDFLLYVSLVTGFVIGWLSTLNLFEPFMPGLVIGRVLTALCIGAGSSFLHETFSGRTEIEVEAEPLRMWGN